MLRRRTTPSSGSPTKTQKPPVKPCAALAHPMAPSATGGYGMTGGVVAEGWVLKKRRKMMQGFARRYFTLHQSGLLSYSFHPGQPTRDQIQLTQAAISSAPGRKDIHIDSNNATFHIKCLSAEDFNKWMTAFRRFIVSGSDTATLGRRSSVARTIPRSAVLPRAGSLLDELGQVSVGRTSPGSSSTEQAHNTQTIEELHSAFQALTEEESKRKVSTKLKAEKDKLKDHAKLGLFKSKKGTHGARESQSEESSATETFSPPSSGSPMQRLQLALNSLRYQHAALTKAMSVVTYPDSAPASRGSPLLPSTAEEVSNSPQSSYATIGKSSHRMSAYSVHSDGSVWYDAPEFDGAEEFVLDGTPGEETQGSQLSYIDSPTLMEEEEEITETESGSEIAEEELRRAMSPTPGIVNGEVISRRFELPSPPVGDEGSLFAVLKKNVGKDLSQVALPVSFNEPLTLLQRLAEELEYYDLLSQASQTKDPIERICYVAAFAVSTYACTRHRSGRKGFNPLLAETFEEPRMKFIAEKVCHNPVILAYHAEGDGWELYATSGGKTKFWGKSLEIIPQGTVHLVIGRDHYEWKRPSSFMRNLMMGTKYLEHCGKMTIHNTTTGVKCALDFKESGYWGPSNLVSGTVYSGSGETEAVLEGKWDDQIAQKLDSSHLRVFWRMNPFPRNAPEYYGFTSFGITLNEVTPDLKGKLPPTDSRLRPDVRALEEGDLDLAEEEKARVEEVQRERRRTDQERTPRWFKQVGDEWQYVGGYWEQRSKGWDLVQPLW